MEKMSRVKKYENLYDDVNGQSDEVNEIESAVNSLRNPDKNNYDYDKMDNHFEDKGSIIEDTNEFKNEYLDSFIQEIKEYNMKKGIIESEDTNLDILKQLSAKQRLKRSGYPIDEELKKVDERETAKNIFSHNKQQNSAPIEGKTTMESRAIDDDIANQVKNLLNDEECSLFSLEKNDTDTSTVDENKADEVIETSKHSISEQMDVISEDEAKLESDITNLEASINKTNIDELTKQRLMEETQKIQVQLDATKAEMNSIQQKVDDNNEKTTKLLNIIIGILVVLFVCGVLFVLFGGKN